MNQHAPSSQKKVQGPDCLVGGVERDVALFPAALSEETSCALQERSEASLLWEGLAELRQPPFFFVVTTLLSMADWRGPVRV